MSTKAQRNRNALSDILSNTCSVKRKKIKGEGHVHSYQIGDKFCEYFEIGLHCHTAYIEAIMTVTGLDPMTTEWDVVRHEIREDNEHPDWMEFA